MGRSRGGSSEMYHGFSRKELERGQGLVGEV